MSETSASLLQRLRERPDGPSWARFVELYWPLIFGWLRRQGVQHADAEDLTQKVFLAVLSELPHFHYDPGRGSFRAWLRTVTANRLRAFWKGPSPLTGGSDVAHLLDQLADP